MNKCVVCDGNHSKLFYIGILKCDHCGHVFADMDLSNEELSALYRRDYFFGDEYSNYLADKKIIQKNFKLRYRNLKPFLRTKRHRTLFEIGCAYGLFLDLIKDEFDHVSGIDISEDGIRYARDELLLDARQVEFLECELEDQKLDVVCLWDTIEHLRDPHLYLEKISTHTEPGALIALTTGDIESLNARWKGDNWRLIHPPTHLHYFSKRTLEQILNRYGFDVVYSRYCGFFRSIDQVAYHTLVLRKNYPNIYKFLNWCRVTRFDFYLNLYDIVYIVAQKRG